MKLLMLTDRMDIGGAETHIFDLVRALIKEKKEVILLCGGGCYAKRLVEEGVRVICAPLHERRGVAVARSARILREVLRSHGVDLIHAHTRYTAALAHAIAPRIPLCATAHLPFSTHGWHRLLCRWGDATLSVSRDIREYLVREYGVPVSRIFPTRNGIDTDTFHPSVRSTKAILHVSRLDRGRSLCARVLLRLAPRLLREHPEYTLRIVGDGDEMDVIRTRAEEANRALGRPAVVLTGAVDDVASELSRGNLFVGVSRALLEAMSTGLACILAGDEGYGGIVSDENFAALSYSNFCGRECAGLQEQTLYRDLCLLMEDAALRERLGAFGARMIRRDYSTERMAKDAMAAYCYALGMSVLLVGYYGHGNLGDELTLSVLLRELQKRNVKRISVVAKESGEHNGVRYIARGDLPRIRAALCHADAVIFGGGNLLQNETSNRSLHYYGMLIHLAKHYGKRLFMISAGVGRVTGARQISYVRTLLSSFDALYLRTEWDVGLARDIFGCKKASYSPDLVFRLAPITARKRNTVGVILHGKKETYGREVFLHELCRRGIAIRYIVLFPEEDLAAAEEYAARFRAEVTVARDYDEVTLALSSCLFSVCERLHGGILSLLSGTRCYLRADGGKCTALARDIERLGKDHGILSRHALPLLSFHYYSEIPLSSLGTEKTEDAAEKKELTEKLDAEAMCAANKKSEPNENVGFAKWINWILNGSSTDPFEFFQ